MAMIESFRIKNYKSIKDSGKCYLDKYITILAGKNEAGKTAIVEALRDFNIDKDIGEEAIPLQDKSLKPEIQLSIILDKNDLKKITERFRTQSKKISELMLEITKIHPNEYLLSEESTSIFVSQKRELVDKVIGVIGLLKQKVTNLPAEDDLIEEMIQNGADTTSMEDLLQAITGENYLPEFKENVNQKEQNKLIRQIQQLKNSAEELNGIVQLEADFLEFVKDNFVPNFILFVTFDDILPDQIPIAEAQNSDIIQDLSLISNLDFSKIQPSAPPDERKQHEEQVNIEIPEEYKRFWTQDRSDLSLWWDSSTMYFRVREGGINYPLRIRSKGRQWHLSFYIRVTARSKEGKNNIILVDEPGLFLHAKAQKDILKKLEECAKQSQLIYTTHSPYLIPSDKLDRVRLVIKDEKQGTKIRKITAKADRETLTPILTAIGEDLSVGIRTDKRNSIVVEGYSDYLWLLALKKLLNIKNELNLIPSTGASSCINIGSILFGWCLDPIFILDNDKEGKQTRKKLKEKLGVEEKRLIQVPLEREGSIENLFSEEDFKKYAKSSAKYSKVLLAQQFKQKVEEGKIKLADLSQETKEGFEDLLNKLNELVK